MDLFDFSTKKAFHLIEESIEVTKDVDIYAFNVHPGQTIAFDIDVPKDSGLKPRIQLFNENGRRLRLPSGKLAANSTGHAPRERTVEPYLEYLFPESATYYLAVSGRTNSSFNPIDGSGDKNGGSIGSYKLLLTPITEFRASGRVDQIYGRIRMPNYNVRPYAKHEPSIEVSLRSLNNQPIRANAPTWVLIHGRINSYKNLEKLAGLLDARVPIRHQVLLLDWASGAKDNSSDFGLDGAEWVPFVADWASTTLNAKLNIRGNNLFLVGHSWGTYVSYEIAKRGPGIEQAIIALDPAQRGTRYPFQKVNFSSVSRISWAFYGDGLYGSASLAKTATESFRLTYEKLGILEFTLRHTLPVRVFEYLVLNNNRASASEFRLRRLIDGEVNQRWSIDAYRIGIEGLFHLEETDSHYWQLKTFTYTTKAGKPEIIKLS